MNLNVRAPGLLLLAIGSLMSCSVRPRDAFRLDAAPMAPDYALEAHWAALPGRLDSADAVPGTGLADRQADADVDVFFIHPTTYTGKRGEKHWNASLNDDRLNLRTDKTTIRYQASLFNGVGRVYAPRYRQAHLEAFYTKKRIAEAEKALRLAYEDVRAAFTYYLEHHNAGQPVIIAAHSQGTAHAGHLLREFFDGKPLKNQLVAAYLVGMPVREGFFEDIPPCETPVQTACFCSWRTVKERWYPRRWGVDDSIVVTNPLSWTTDPGWADRSLHRGAVFKRFEAGPYPNFTGARISRGYLWIPRPRIPGYLFVPLRNYHVADYNLFYVNVRENARLRTEAYFEAKS
ncbi:MAG: DUF3089 domain-containing protein [Saprospiraceae bacterium]|nr:DUF3089 domain-containing protein [Saprospiraceae bacterium]